MFPFAAASPAPRAFSKPADSTALLERAPGLREGAERVLTSIVKSLQTMAGETTTIDGMVAGVTATPMRDLIVAHRAEAVAATIQCAGLPCTMLVTLEPTLVHAVVELLAGGNGTEPLPAVPRAVTSIDQQYAHIIVTLAAAAIEKEWAANGFGTARAVRLDGGIAADICGPRVAQVGVVTLALGIFGQRGTLALALPPAALDVFPSVESPAPEPAVSPDPAWNNLLKRELGRAPVKVDAYLEAQELSLGAIAELQPGQVIALVPMARGRATLVCDGRSLYRGELGQHDDRFSLRIEEIIAAMPEAPTGLLGNRIRKTFDMTKAS